MAKSLRDYKAEANKQWAKPAEPTISAPYFTLPPIEGHGVVIPVEAFEDRDFTTTLQNAKVIVVLVTAVCTLFALYSASEIWTVADRAFAGRTSDSTEDLGTFLAHAVYLTGALFGLRFIWRVAPKKLELTFSEKGIRYVFWTPSGDLTKEALYTSYNGIRQEHTRVRHRYGQHDTHKVMLVHPDPLLTLTLVTLSGDFDQRLCELYAQATGLPILEPHSNGPLWRIRFKRS